MKRKIKVGLNNLFSNQTKNKSIIHQQQELAEKGMSSEKEQHIQTESVRELANPNNDIPETSVDIKYRNLLEVDQKTLPGYLQKLLTKKKNQKKDLKNELRKLTLAKLKRELGIKDEGDLFDVQTNIRDKNIKLTAENLENLSSSGDPQDQMLFRTLAQQEYIKPGSVFGYSEASPVSFDSFRYGSLDKYLMPPPAAYAAPSAPEIIEPISAGSSPRTGFRPVQMTERRPSPRKMSSGFVPALSAAPSETSSAASSRASSRASGWVSKRLKELNENIFELENSLDYFNKIKDTHPEKEVEDTIDIENQLMEYKAERLNLLGKINTKSTNDKQDKDFTESIINKITSDSSTDIIDLPQGRGLKFVISDRIIPNIEIVAQKAGQSKASRIAEKIRNSDIPFQIRHKKDGVTKYIVLTPVTSAKSSAKASAKSSAKSSDSSSSSEDIEPELLRKKPSKKQPKSFMRDI